MNNKKAPWQRTFEAFAGPGVRHPSDTMRVGEDEAAAQLLTLAALDWQPPGPAGNGRHAPYSICNALGTWATVLRHGGRVVGFYAGSYLWIAPAHRGLGLSTPLILAAAEQRGGGTLPPGVVFQGYTAAGVAAHRTAHRHAVLTALAEGRPVPPAVIDEIRARDADSAAAQPALATLEGNGADDKPAG